MLISGEHIPFIFGPFCLRGAACCGEIVCLALHSAFCRLLQSVMRSSQRKDAKCCEEVKGPAARVALREVVAQCMARWFRAAQKAAEQGDVASQSLLGQMLMSGYGTQQDAVQGVYWLQKAADKDDADAKSMLASLVPGGAGVAAALEIEELSIEDNKSPVADSPWLPSSSLPSQQEEM